MCALTKQSSKVDNNRFVYCLNPAILEQITT